MLTSWATLVAAAAAKTGLKERKRLNLLIKIDKLFGLISPHNARYNKTGLQHVSRPVEQILCSFKELKKLPKK